MRFYVGKGLEEYLQQLGKLQNDGYLKQAIYPAAGKVAEAVKKNIESLPECHPGGSYGVTKTQKEGLLEGFGIASFKNEDGYLQVKLGFDGYNKQRSKKYPNGQPNAMIARSIEKGTSWSKKIRFVNTAVKATKDEAEAMMKVAIDKNIEKIMKS